MTLRPVGRRNIVGRLMVFAAGHFAVFLVTDGGQGALRFVRLGGGFGPRPDVGFLVMSYFCRFSASDSTSQALTKTWKSVVVVPFDLSGW